MSEQRRDARYAARIVARLGRKNQMVEYLTNDVSFRGVFLRTDAPPALRQLVRVELVLPDGVVVSGHAMVVHVAARAPDLPKGEGPVPGIGLQFWGPIERAREWERFIHDLRHRHKVGTALAKAEDKVRRASERFKLAIEVVLDGNTTMTRDISLSGMAIRTDKPLPVGARTELSVRAGEQTLVFDAIVRRAVDEPNFRGLGVELVDVTPEKHQELLRLVQAHAPSEERIFVSPNDPKLH